MPKKPARILDHRMARSDHPFGVNVGAEVEEKTKAEWEAEVEDFLAGIKHDEQELESNPDETQSCTVMPFPLPPSCFHSFLVHVRPSTSVLAVVGNLALHSGIT